MQAVASQRAERTFLPTVASINAPSAPAAPPVGRDPVGQSDPRRATRIVSAPLPQKAALAPPRSAKPRVSTKSTLAKTLATPSKKPLLGGHDVVLALVGEKPPVNISTITDSRQCVDAPAGHLVIVGGHGTTPEINARTMALAGGNQARVVLLPQASSEPDRGIEDAEMWLKEGAASARVLDPLDASARDAIRNATFIWMGGGDQKDLMDTLRANNLVGELRAAYENGAVIGGTSAGAAAMSDVMIWGGRGTGLLPNDIVDMHFSQRQRLPRLLEAIDARPDGIDMGIGIDETTAVILSNGRAQVVGDGGVTLIDAHTSPITSRVVPHGDSFSMPQLCPRDDEESPADRK